MDIRRLSDTLTEIDGVIRIESGPVRRTEKATEELLSDEVTASHYFAGKRRVKVRDRRTGQEREVEKVGVDALGKPIVIGKPMHFIDWKNRHTARAFYVYARDGTGRFQPVGTHETEDAAMSQAATLAAERAAAGKGQD